ncbi:MAG: sigma-54 dependent transcriptional regulator [Sandaracinaceae bacterium]
MGSKLLERGRELMPHGTFVVMTAFGSIDTAVAAIRRGAENYVTKPLDFDALGALVERAMEKAKLSAEAAELRERLEERYSIGEIIGDHPSMQRLLKTMAQVANSRATVLIHGETGTGKELIAAALHQHSKRKNGPFVRLNCAALAESLLESELFGHERGSFTGATGRREGRFEQADGGTLFLDEVSEIPLSIQVKLLRFLQEREFERVGSNETVRVDVRVVAATNRDLTQLVEDGDFREDLFYRLNVISLEVPPLRRRSSDVPLLAMHFLRRFARDNDREILGFTPDAMRALVSHSWPGNVRELENAVERAVVLCHSTEIDAELLPGSSEGMRPKGKTGEALDLMFPGTTLAELERIAIEKTLAAVGGSTAKAAEILGVSRRKIQYRLKEWAIEEEE